MKNPPLSLYIHLPWCVRKCPYCDFNSHAAVNDIPGREYVDLLLMDLEAELPLVWGRPVHSVFIGGGTPSLFDAELIGLLLAGVRARLPLAPGAEVTLEANPGTVEHDSFKAYRQAGVNRVSLGVQSFDDESLRKLGRIHGGHEALTAVEQLHGAGLESFNIDLMFGLPGQTVELAQQDLRQALACQPPHLSRYQLTIEPNTAFHAAPPTLPPDDDTWLMQERGEELLQRAGLEQYEISAWARPGMECRHNLNYWRFGDYIGIGAGAHGKLTLAESGEVRRRARQRHPKAWMQAVTDGNSLAEERCLQDKELIFEFFLNQLRLRRGVSKTDFQERTGLAWRKAAKPLAKALESGLLNEQGERFVSTDLGWQFVNDTQALFLP